MASDKRKIYDTFEKGSRRKGGSRTSYSKPISDSAAKKRNDMLIGIIMDILLCVLVPPYGLYRMLTKEDMILPVKLAGIVLSGLMMFVWFTIILPDEQPDPISITAARPAAVEIYSSAE